MSTLVDQARKVIAALDFVFRDGNVEAVQSAQELIRQLADRVQELEGKGEPVAWVTDADVACFGKGEKGEIVALLQKKAKWRHPLYAAPVQPEKEERNG